MRRVRSSHVWIAAVVATAAAFSSTAVGAKGPRPLVVVLEGFAGPAPTSDPCVLANHEHGTGHATHLGRITWTSQETVNQCSNPDGADVEGEIVITAANGDRLTASYTTLATLDFTTNQVTALGRFVITGGTGRFAGAGGHGLIGAQGSLLPPFAVVGSLAGRIAY